MQPLDAAAKHWVDQTLASLSLNEKLAQMMLPIAGDDARMEKLLGLMGEMPIGGGFFWGNTPEVHRERIRRYQAASRVPMIMAADLENGPGYVVQGTAMFPDLLALAAADDERLAYTMAKAAAIHGRNVGMHWTFAPIVDVNLNPDNSITNTRGLGDDPERIIRLSSAMIRGFQDHGLAACAKHFPGDGVDDIDQHVMTTVNSLPLERWKGLHGRTFSAAYELGVWTTMIGHIAFPAWDGERDGRGALRPATLSRRIVTDLLRREMGFDGLIVTDDMNMGGAAAYANREERAIACIAAGCDMFLFPHLPEDFHTLLAAVQSGRIPEQRITDAARRVLELKARVGLHKGELFGRDATEAERAEFDAAAREIAAKAVTCARDFNARFPLKLKPGAKVLTVTLVIDGVELPVVDEELRKRGYQVDHLVNPDNSMFIDTAMKYDAVFVNFTQKAHWCVGSVRCVGPQNRMWMLGFYNEHPCAVFTSFGSPYHLRSFGTLPNLVNMHSSSADSQRAAVAAWFGEIPMAGRSPVGNLVRAY
ncbi:MAG: hypothetical protein JXB04_02515 [Kiritimatiellae bacterium]|nr:hypothetical protein [Kiritimatiellia bacterium]